MPGSLNSDQVKRYRQDGYLCPMDLLDRVQLHGTRDFAMMARGVDNTRNWVHLAPPVCLFDSDNLALYEDIRTEQTRVLMRETA